METVCCVRPCQGMGGEWHDRIKTELMSMFRWSGIVATCEVWGLFKHLVPEEALSDQEVYKQKQVMIPDFRVQLSSPTGVTDTRLAELKFTCSKDCYKPGVRQRQFRKAVDRRADKLMEEYRKKAGNLDRLIGEEGG